MPFKNIISIKVQLILNTFFLVALPIFEALQVALPKLAEFMPTHTYQIVGLIVVLGNILLSTLIPKVRS